MKGQNMLKLTNMLKIDTGVTCICYLPTREKTVDMLTKGLPNGQVDKLINKLVWKIFSNQLEGEC